MNLKNSLSLGSIARYRRPTRPLSSTTSRPARPQASCSIRNQSVLSPYRVHTTMTTTVSEIMRLRNLARPHMKCLIS